MPNDILKVSDKRVLLSGPITSYSYEIGYTFTSQGASICFLTPNTDKAQRICDTLNEARELHRNYGRATFSSLDIVNPDIDKSIAAALQTVSGLDIYIDALNIFDPKSLSQNVQITLLDKISNILIERQRGRLVLLFDNSLLHLEDNKLFLEFRTKATDWFSQNQDALMQQNIMAHQITLSLTEDSLLYKNPQKTINESVKTLNEQKNLNLKVTRPDHISKVLIATVSDLTASLRPTTFNLQ